jgi:hypothetical protein
MISLRRSKWGIPYLQRWFARRGRLGDWLGTDAPAPADRDDFISRYRAFAQEKRIAPLSRSQLESFGNSLFLSKALREDHWVSPLYALAEKLGRL